MQQTAQRMAKIHPSSKHFKNMKFEDYAHILSHWGPDESQGWEGWPVFIEKWWNEVGSKIDPAKYRREL